MIATDMAKDPTPATRARWSWPMPPAPRSPRPAPPKITMVDSSSRPPRFTRSRVTYEAYAVSRTSTRPQVDRALELVDLFHHGSSLPFYRNHFHHGKVARGSRPGIGFESDPRARGPWTVPNKGSAHKTGDGSQGSKDPLVERRGGGSWMQAWNTSRGVSRVDVTDTADNAAQFRARDGRSESGVAAAPICAWVKARAHG